MAQGAVSENLRSFFTKEGSYIPYVIKVFLGKVIPQLMYGSQLCLYEDSIPWRQHNLNFSDPY